MSKCVGLLGRLLGHKYEAVYETQKEYLSAQDKANLIITEFNSSIYHGFIDETNCSYLQPKQVTKVYLGHVCKRCGSKVNDNILI